MANKALFYDTASAEDQLNHIKQDLHITQQKLDKSEYFDALYQHDDPWSYDVRWYEARKRQICLALLPKKRYAHVLELGCGNGVLTQLLAQRCDQLIAVDANAKAVTLAQARLIHDPHVTVQQCCLPEQYVEGKFDLILVSEIAYYLEPAELCTLIGLIQSSLTDDGMLLCCHWRYDIEGFELNGEKVHTLFAEQLDLHRALHLNDQDFVIDLWQKQSASLAKCEGLI